MSEGCKWTLTKPVCHLHGVPLKIHIAIIILTKLVYVNEGWCSITLDMACLFRAQMSMVIHYLPGASVLTAQSCRGKFTEGTAGHCCHLVFTLRTAQRTTDAVEH